MSAVALTTTLWKDRTCDTIEGTQQARITLCELFCYIKNGHLQLRDSRIVSTAVSLRDRITQSIRVAHLPSGYPITDSSDLFSNTTP